MGFLSSLFGGGKPKEKAAAPVKATAEAVVAPKAAAKAPEAKPAAKVVEAEAKAVKATASAAAPAIEIAASGTGAEQVKLRLKLAAASRTGDIEAAYRAAKGLADIQAKAGRRVPARIWRAEAERIIEEM